MTWNYRVIKKTIEQENSYGIHEVFYNQNGDIKGATEKPISVTWIDDESPKDILAMITKALELPIIDIEEIENCSWD